MTVVNPAWLGKELTPDQMYAEINAMAVDLDYFATVSCLYERAFGMRTFFERPDCDTVDLNHCARRNLWTLLYSISQELELQLRWNLGPRYHEEEHLWVPGRRIALNYGGVEEVNVQLRAEPIPGLTSAPLDPYILRDVKQRDRVSYTELLIPASDVRNPRHIQFRKDGSDEMLPVQTRNDYPRREVVDGEAHWVFALSKVLDPGDKVNVLHYELSFVDVVIPAGYEDTAFPVYKGTTQRIPLEKKEALATGETRFWIRLRNLIDPAFEDEVVDLNQNDLYKLVPEVEFRAFLEVDRRADIYAMPNDKELLDDPGKVVIYPAIARIISSETGTIEITEVSADGKGIGPCSAATSAENRNTPYRVRVYYKTSPYIFGSQYANAIEELRRAVAMRAAAELPMSQCGCEESPSFISDQQKVIDDVRINPFSGETVIKSRYGNRAGQQAFASTLSTTPRAAKTEYV